MKFLYILILSGCLVFSGFAQKKKPQNLPGYDNKVLHFGFTLGLNTMDFNIQKSGDFYWLNNIYAIENLRQFGFNISIVSSLRLREYLDLRFLPGLSFGQRNLEYIELDTIINDNPIFSNRVMQIESTFIQFPLLFKYKSERVNNFRAYIVGGGNFSIDLAAQKDIKESERPKIKLKPLDVYYEIGFGIDYYLTYFKFSTELKLAVGIMDIIGEADPEYPQYNSAIERMNSKLIILSFHFE